MMSFVLSNVDYFSIAGNDDIVKMIVEGISEELMF